MKVHLRAISVLTEYILLLLLLLSKYQAIRFSQCWLLHSDQIYIHTHMGDRGGRTGENGSDVFHRNRWTKSTSSSSSSSSISMNKEMRKYHANSQHWSELGIMCTDTSTNTLTHTCIHKHYTSIYTTIISVRSSEYRTHIRIQQHKYGMEWPRIPGSIWHWNVHLSV